MVCPRPSAKFQLFLTGLCHFPTPPPQPGAQPPPAAKGRRGQREGGGHQLLHSDHSGPGSLPPFICGQEPMLERQARNTLLWCGLSGPDPSTSRSLFRSDERGWRGETRVRRHISPDADASARASTQTAIANYEQTSLLCYPHCCQPYGLYAAPLAGLPGGTGGTGSGCWCCCWIRSSYCCLR